MPSDFASSCVRRRTAKEKPATAHMHMALILLSKETVPDFGRTKRRNQLRQEDAYMQRETHRQRSQLCQLHQAACSVLLHSMDVENLVWPTAAPTWTALVNVPLVRNSRPITPTSRHLEKDKRHRRLCRQQQDGKHGRVLPCHSLSLSLVSWHDYRLPSATHPVALLC